MSTEEKINLKFLVHLRKSLLQEFEMLQQVDEDNTILCKHAFEWHKRFKEGQQRGEKLLKEWEAFNK